ncbi:hypothetical protein ZWY2020_009921 [Hordeum vulgare]|nr:hypothetical protein ZWY2020_009921 [Hordeum vulgare]
MSKQNHCNLAGSLRCCGGDHPLRKHGHDEEWRDWPNLPTVLLDDIVGRLLLYDVAEYIRLRAACKEWRNCTDDPRMGGGLDCRFRPRRWIMLSNRTKGDGRRFLNLSTGASACVNLPELSRHHLETSTEGLLLLRGKASHTVRLFNPLNRAFTNLPPITPDLGRAYIVWTGLLESSERLIYAGISEETSPASVVLLMIDQGRAIVYAKPGDQRWAVIEHDEIGRLDRYSSYRLSSASTLQGRFYFATLEGNIMHVRLCPEPRLVPVVVNQPKTRGHVSSYLVPPDDHRCGSMLMVRYYLDLDHLSANERRIITRRRKRMDVIRVGNRLKECQWNLIQVFEVNVARKRLVPVEDIGRHRAVFVGEAACFSLSARTFPCVAGNAVHLGATGARYPPVGVRYLADKSADPPFEFTTDGPASPDEPLKWYHRHNRPELNLFLDTGSELNLVPLARPCTLQEYLVCCAGLPGGLKD